MSQYQRVMVGDKSILTNHGIVTDVLRASTASAALAPRSAPRVALEDMTSIDAANLAIDSRSF